MRDNPINHKHKRQKIYSVKTLTKEKKQLIREKFINKVKTLIKIQTLKILSITQIPINMM